MRKTGVLLEELALPGLFDVGLNGDETLFADLAEELVHHPEGFEVAGFAELRSAEDAENTRDHALEDVDGVGDEERADGGTADGDHLGGLEEDKEMTLLHEEAGDNGSEDDDYADDCEHVRPWVLFGVIGRRRLGA